MHAGEFEPVRGVDDLYVHDTGMFDTDEYGAVYVWNAERPIVIDTGTGANREALFETLDEIGIGHEESAWICRRTRTSTTRAGRVTWRSATRTPRLPFPRGG